MVTVVNLPNVGYRSCKFHPIQPRDTGRMEGRRTESQKFGTPYWVGTWETTALELPAFGLVEAFEMAAGDNGEVFAAYDASRPRPVLQDSGSPLSGVKALGGVFNGDAVLQSISNPLLIAVSGLPALFKLSVGDYVEVRKSPTVRSLHRIQANATANESGVVSLPIRYALDLQTFTLPCTVHFEKPSCLMQIDPGSYEARKELVYREASWSATEVFFS
ncbi:hypothetical protein SAMN05428967_4475 [Phyllobacterium sp. YR620]|uniref:hypothetical protein n=1 Tax=Phyllobacterium sp. YR620 TaxID=1881066 RepID=UPI000883FEBA|nr:hypothetical protein [Phyllobacterium sp. YR620]SDP92531.1 hypothetical protein SAMN05428967_4475 [Phyllobacterium sp. YR620]